MHCNFYKSGLVLGLATCGLGRLVTVPTIPFVERNDTYSLSQLTGIVVDARYADAVDNQGQTSIPTLQEFAATFQDDLRSSLGIDLPLISGSGPGNHSIFLTLVNNTGFHDVAGRFTSEAYALDVHSNGITIAGASPLGVWWGSRSLIQAAVISDHSLPQGSAVDAPGWGTRGIMLDVGRHYYPPYFLIEMCSYLSFFKQNVFHLHLSDNLYNNVDLYSTEQSMNLYAAFRPWSDDPTVAGLNKRANESYTRTQFDHIQHQCAHRGVTIIPEIEAPGHALSIVQWRPELGLTDLSMLNISHPDTIPTMKTIWKTFLPWFHSKTVHLGADEYSSSYVSDYTHFVNEMHTYIGQESTKNTRIWGTFTPSEGANVSTAVTIQHWEFFEDNPYFDYIKNNYSVLNSDDAFYIVGKWSGSYPQHLNKTRVFHGNPANHGPYAPNIFDTNNATNNPPRDNPNVLGHLAALWNDYGPNATTYLEAYYSFRNVLPALADKQWGGDLLEAEYDYVFNSLHATIPAQNLDRSIPSTSDLIFHYPCTTTNTTSTQCLIPDTSGNNYHAHLHGAGCTLTNHTLFLNETCHLTTPLQSKGRNYTLSFSINPSTSHPGILFSGLDSTLLNGNGSISNITLVSGGNPYSLNYSLPVGVWTDVKLMGRGNRTLLSVNGGMEMEFLARLGVNGERLVWGPIAVEAPWGMGCL
ncbi:beta-hexosaminidase [Aspergillus sclerotioniger CBS 115572]|uniref:beta-N-acetylhexosaminidase n=1 Tax=Aspergillus sclerotioniger CBS 115572 TaxID=1450535 RepID=A0A317XFQ9_9EURO|nr:beta-hexosaminidase [Aspergillus sclerotioniger CBS 115572]PWY96657.1 beta-hexosaminidase [Aspergillus sclerotioniger CBS 115572]